MFYCILLYFIIFYCILLFSILNQTKHTLLQCPGLRRGRQGNPCTGQSLTLIGRYLGHSQPIVCLLHGLPGVVHRLALVPLVPVRAETWGESSGLTWTQTEIHDYQLNNVQWCWWTLFILSSHHHQVNQVGRNLGAPRPPIRDWIIHPKSRLNFRIVLIAEWDPLVFILQMIQILNVLNRLQMP